MKAVVACEVVERDGEYMCIGMIICGCRGERDVVVEGPGCSQAFSILGTDGFLLHLKAGCEPRQSLQMCSLRHDAQE